MSPTQSRAFHAVATAGSFTAASKALNVSQPTITTQVKELELLYGVELFHRHPRGVTLTDVGRELLVIIRRIHANQQDAIQYLQTVQDMRIGHLRIGSYGPYDVIEILAEFTRRYLNHIHVRSLAVLFKPASAEELQETLAKFPRGLRMDVQDRMAAIEPPSAARTRAAAHHVLAAVFTQCFDPNLEDVGFSLPAYAAPTCDRCGGHVVV